MTAESMRERFEAWYDAFEFRRDYDKYGPSAAAFEVWQAATLAARERCASVCDEIALNTEPDHFALDTAYACAEAIRKGE